jgi:hypothetical protein
MDILIQVMCSMGLKCMMAIDRFSLAHHNVQLMHLHVEPCHATSYLVHSSKFSSFNGEKKCSEC